MANGTTRYIKGRDGKFKGSVGGGKGTVAPNVKPAVPQTPRNTSTPTGKQSLADEVANATVYERRVWANHRSPADPQRLTLLASDPDTLTRETVARNPKTPEGALMRLAQDDNEEVRVRAVEEFLSRISRVTEDAGASAVLAKRLATLLKNTRNLPDGEKIALASSRNVHPPQQRVLAEDPNSDVRACVAGNTETLPRVLASLAEDTEPSVRERVAGNENTPRRVLLHLSTTDDSEFVRAAARRNPETPENQTAFDVRSTNPHRRERAVKSGLLSDSQVDWLQQHDPDPHVRQEARNEWDRRHPPRDWVHNPARFN